MNANEMTFNDVPAMIGKMFQKIEHVEQLLDNMRKELDAKQKPTSEHTPMTLEEACEFLRMKKSTMYYKLGRKEIPATKNGKYYIFYKDELIKWTELGRVDTEMKSSFQLQEEDALSRVGRRTKRNF